MYNSEMLSRNLRRFVVIFGFIISIILILWSVWPFGEASVELQLKPTDMQFQLPQSSTPAITETRLLILKWPPKIRVNEPDVIRLTLDVDKPMNVSPSAEIDGHETPEGEIKLPNVYDTHNVIATARLDIGVLQISPNNLIEQSLVPGERVDFYWHVTANEIGTFQGTVWLYLRYIPLDGGDEIVKPLTAQVIEVISVSMFGLGSTPARLLGFIGILFSILLGMDEFLVLLKRSH